MREIEAFDLAGKSIGKFHFSGGETLNPLLIYGTRYFLLCTYKNEQVYNQTCPSWKGILYTNHNDNAKT